MAASLMDGFKLDPPHSPECYLSPGRQEFIVYDGWESRDRIGRRQQQGTGQWWHRFKCNCIQCDARLLVRWDVLMNFLATGAAKENV
jgi:hypothetical protein